MARAEREKFVEARGRAEEKHVEEVEVIEEICLDMSFSKDILKVTGKIKYILKRAVEYFEMYGKRTGVIELYTDICKKR